MSLARLLTRIKPLLADPEQNWSQLVALLDGHRTLAEYEVARHLVSKVVEPSLEALLAHADPLEQRRGLEMLRVVGSRPVVARHLRPLVKHGNRQLRSRARAIVKELGIRDVALRDSRGPLPRHTRGFVPGGFNPSGWWFGSYRARISQWGSAWWFPAGEARQVPLAPLPERSALPALPDVQALATFLGVASPADLVRFTRPGSGPGAPYVDFDVPKRSGGTRRISAPRPKLRTIQRTILRLLLDPLPLHEAAHGFVKGRSTVSNARPHLGAKLLIKLDLKDFFPSVHYRRVLGLFRHYGFELEVATLLARLTTRRAQLDDGRVVWPGVLPQGAPTSPAIANLLCRRLDSRLSGLAAKVGARYTRYADDLTFSFASDPDVRVGRFLWWVDQVCGQEGFTLNPRKRRVLRPSAQQRVTGVVVNSSLTIPRRERRRFRAILHNCRTQGVASQARGRSDFEAYLRGYASYVKMVQPALGAKLVGEVEALLAP